MLRFLFGDNRQELPDDFVRMRWLDDEHFFAVEVPASSRAVQLRYADFDGDKFNPDTGRGGMYDDAQEHFMSSGIDRRFGELELENERYMRDTWKVQGHRFMLFVSTYLWPRWPRLRLAFQRRHAASVRRCQVVELARHVSVLRTLLELERKQQGSGSGGGGKRKRPTVPAHKIAHTAPTSLSLH